VFQKLEHEFESLCFQEGRKKKKEKKKKKNKKKKTGKGRKKKGEKKKEKKNNIFAQPATRVKLVRKQAGS